MTLKRAGSLVAALFPTPLPSTDQGFKDWSEAVLKLSGLPVNDGLIHALGTQIMHLGETTAYKPKLYFVLALKAAVSKQAAFNAIDDIRRKEHAARAQAQQDQVAETSKAMV